jgi:23S rRNA pseudouridine1911/1915/1917 synthase
MPDTRGADDDELPGGLPGNAREEPRIIEVTNTAAPQRLDIFLREHLSDHTRSFIQRLIEEGCVSLDPPRPIKQGLKVPSGTRVRVVIRPPRPINLSPEDIPIPILFEDEYLAVIDKPAGLAVHPAPDQVGSTLVNALLFHLTDLSGIGGEERPGIVHRLDKETSGLLLVAKNDFAHNSLASQFKERLVHKTYLAIARGEPQEWDGRIDYNLGRSYTHTKKQMIRTDGTGRSAVTHYRVLEVFRGYALIELYPQTGRTHQIRVHLASLRLPVACDKLYGREKRIYLSDLRGCEREADEAPLLERHALHAAGIAFRHPLTREELIFSSPLPADLHALHKALERHRAHR